MKRPKLESDNEVLGVQRNIVFPDTVRNEGEFYRRMLSSRVRLNGVQKAGVFVLVVSFAVISSIYFRSILQSMAEVKGPLGVKLLVGVRLLVLGHVGTVLALFGVFFVVRGLQAIFRK